jgi:hypothetical protein
VGNALTRKIVDASPLLVPPVIGVEGLIAMLSVVTTPDEASADRVRVRKPDFVNVRVTVLALSVL